MDWEQDQNVIVHSLGDDKEYLAKIAGIAMDIPGAKIMIIKLDQHHNIRNDYSYSHMCITEHCLRTDEDNV